MAVVPEVLTDFLDLLPELGRAVVGVEFPSLSADVVVGAVEVRAVDAFCNLQPPHDDDDFSFSL